MNQAQSHAVSGNAADRETGLIRKVALYAFLLNLGLAIMKGALAILSQSLAVMAGAIDSGTDALASLVLYAGVILSVRKYSAFPLGLYKIENLIAVFVALSIFFAGYEIARTVWFGSGAPPEISTGIVALLIVGSMATFAFGRYAMMIGRRTASPTLMAEGRHRQVDVLSSLVVLASVLPAYFKWNFSPFGVTFDQIAASVVLIFIAVAGWEMLSDGMRVLLDASVDYDTLAQVRGILNAHPMVVSVQSLIGRNAGRFRFLQTNITLRTGDLQKAHRISEALEADIREKIPHVERVMIHYEPQPRTHIRFAVPLADPSGDIADHFGEAPHFAIVTVRLSDRHVEKQEVIENPYRDVGTAKGIRVAEWLVEQKVDQVFMREDLSRKGPGYVLGNAGVTTVLTSARVVTEVMEGFDTEIPR
ncbi:MAG: cation diffusion facilitator family transporter [Deltaproteobacteria bacterium]|nr:cation diffusion facilitator family transporter [Deltaproteobacteria bacterium]